MQQILDLHIHSKYSRACSRDLELPNIGRACEVRGIDVVATGDFTHPEWFKHIKDNLKECEEGIYKLKDPTPTLPLKVEGDCNGSVKFILGTEIASIKKHKDATRRLHLCIFAPDIQTVEKFNKKLNNLNINLASDGRPILGMTGKQILETMLEVDERMMMIPAHAWTPWFGVFGSKSGYDSLKDCFEDLTPYIHAIETGLSSDPVMNWQWSALDNITLISNSDAHSTAKLGREANVFEFKDEKEINYKNIFDIIKTGDKKKFKYTIEFYPEEGKYHFDGHRDCKFVCSPEETRRRLGLCPKCKKKLTVGVQYRVDELSDRSLDEAKKLKNKIPYKSMVPLPEILASVFGCGVNTKKVKEAYNNLINNLGSEFSILIKEDLKNIEDTSSKLIASAIRRVREGNIYVEPGYDGEFGVVRVFKDNEKRVGLK